MNEWMNEWLNNTHMLLNIIKLVYVTEIDNEKGRLSWRWWWENIKRTNKNVGICYKELKQSTSE
jgi:hypothetical protein